MPVDFRDDPPVTAVNESDSEDDIDRMEKERRDDLDERDAFAKRLLKKDKEKTRQVMSKTDKKVCSIEFVLLKKDKEKTRQVMSKTDKKVC